SRVGDKGAVHSEESHTGRLGGLVPPLPLEDVEMRWVLISKDKTHDIVIRVRIDPKEAVDSPIGDREVAQVCGCVRVTRLTERIRGLIKDPGGLGVDRVLDLHDGETAQVERLGLS